MIRYIEGDLLSSDAQALVNTVNTVGVMGKGIALQFKERFPNNLNIYLSACKSNEMQPGKLLVTEEITMTGEKKVIINFPTKKDWKHKSKYEYIEEGLKDLVKVINERNIKSVAIPPLGCGNGGLDWGEVKNLMEKYLTQLSNVEISIFEPNESIKEILKQQDANKEVILTPARAMLLYSMFYYESLGENSSLFVANKLAYLMQRLGERSFSKLNFTASHYGPYCIGVDHVVHALNGKYLKGLEQMKLTAFEPIELQYDRMKEISEYVRKELKSEQKDILKKLVELINGFQSSLSLEILASVDFVKKDNPGISKAEAIQKIQVWSRRKRNLFKEKYIIIAYDHLEEYANKFEITA
jgi:O-acetyl-ADP-ribose deacetylase (regulator of RNase III)